MASTAHVGETRALVFPVMSDGYLLLDYSEYNDSNYKHNLWDHKNEPFTFEAILTPYDVNGIGHRTTGQGRLDSTKTPPSPNLTQMTMQMTPHHTKALHTSGQEETRTR